MRVQPNLYEFAAITALKETPRNKDPGLVACLPQQATRSHLGDRVACMWAAGRTLRVRLIGGSTHVRNKVKQYALTWLEYASIKMEFVDYGEAEIRVGFREGQGFWSFVGTDCLTVNAHEPTMNFGWFDDFTPDEELAKNSNP